MSFILLGFARHVTVTTNPTGRDPSEPPENWLKGHPKCRIVAGDNLNNAERDVDGKSTMAGPCRRGLLSARPFAEPRLDDLMVVP
jgi:hypothetical protein